MQSPHLPSGELTLSVHIHVCMLYTRAEIYNYNPYFFQDICTRTEGCDLTSTAREVLEVLSIIGVVSSLVGIVLTITTLCMKY